MDEGMMGLEPGLKRYCSRSNFVLSSFIVVVSYKSRLYQCRLFAGQARYNMQRKLRKVTPRKWHLDFGRHDPNHDCPVPAVNAISAVAV